MFRICTIMTSKESHKKSMKKWLAKNPSYNHNYYLKHKENWPIRTYTVPQYAKKLSKQRSHYNHIKFELMEFLSGNPPQCIKCGFRDMRVLQFDHINGTGAKNKKKFKGQKTEMLYLYYHPLEAKKTIQVLCANCNWIKRYEKLEYNRMRQVG